MLTQEENELLTRVSGDAPMGHMIRKHWWIPAGLSASLVADGKPLRVRLLGNNYVAFRATNDKLGFFDEACPHRGASLALGRNEENGLRCIYHGWKFGVDGETVAVPTQPNNEAAYCKHVPLKSYPVHEEAGMFWVWLGEGGEPPKFQRFEFCGLPKDQVVIVRQKVNTNWLQGVETTMDSAHLGVLHQSWLRGAAGDIGKSSENMAPVYHIEQKPYGFRYASVRALADGQSYVRTNSFVLPWYGVVAPGRSTSRGGNFFFAVPIDDENMWYWNIVYDFERPIEITPQVSVTQPESWPPLPPGPPEDNWGQDRAAMAAGHFTGFPQSLGTEDFAVVMSMGPISDRTKEYLGAGDGAVVQVRRCLGSAVREFMQDQVPAFARHEQIPYEQIKPVAAVFDGEARWKEML